VSDDDVARLGEEADRVVRLVGKRSYMRMADGHCIALEIRPRTDGGGPEFFCSLYDRRPQVCRDLRRGSKECFGELATKAHRVAADTASISRPLRRAAR
jgi:hypothetical protein